MAQAEIRGLRLWYETFGEGGTPVLLIMGLGLPGSAWAPLVPLLATRYRVAAFDHRGIGRSEKPREVYRIETLAADAVGLMDRLGWESAHLVGVSLGGLVALEVALSFRPRVRSLALLATYAGGGLLWMPSLRSMLLMLQVVFARGERHLRALQRQLLSPAFLARVDPDLLTTGMRQQLGPRPPSRAALGQLLGFFAYNAWPRLGQLAGLPTLVAHGCGDIVLPCKLGKRLAAAIPGARLVIDPEAGHGLILERAEEMSRLLLEHFGAADAALSGPG